MKLRLLATLAIAFLATVSCGSSDEDASSATTTTPPAPTTTTAATTATTTTTQPPTTATAASDGLDAPQDIAKSFIAARDAWDGETTRSLVATDAVIDGFVATADEYLTNDEFERATGWRFMLPDCTETVAGPPAKVTCTYTMENDWSRALGVGPFTGSSFGFVIADGQIQQLNHTFNITQFSPQVWEVFLAWVRDSHPQDVEVMYDLSGSIERPRKTPDAIVLWEQHTNEFVTSMTES